MSVITNAPPPPPAPGSPPVETKITPSGWWYLPAIFVLVAGVIGGTAVIITEIVNLSRLVDDFARIVVTDGAATQPLTFDRAGRFVLYYEFESEVDGSGFAGNDGNLPAVIDATVTDAEGNPLIVRNEANDFSFSFSGTAGISFGSVRIPEPGTYTVAITSSEQTPFVVSVGPSMLGRLARTILGGLALIGVGVVLGVVWIVTLAVKRGRRKRERRQATAAASPSPGYGYGYGQPWGSAPPPPSGWAPTPTPPPPPTGWTPPPTPPPPPGPGWVPPAPGSPAPPAPPPSAGAPPAPGPYPATPGDRPAPPPGRWVQPGQD